MKLTAKMEPFDSFWEAPEDVERGYTSFSKFYERNYLKYIPENREASILVVSCGPGYFVSLLNKKGYSRVLGVDSDPRKVEYALKRRLNCTTEEAFVFLEKHHEEFDLIIAEQEINHLTKQEILAFLKLCRNSLTKQGILILHSLNGANPITGSESLTQNIDHYVLFTEYSLRQILQYSGFKEIDVIPLNLWVFYENPLNYIGLFLDRLYRIFFRFSFLLYGKSNKLFTKKIAAVCKKNI